MWHWFIPWELSPSAIIIMLIAVILYMRGSCVVKPPIWQQICFWLGLFSIYFVLQTHFDYYAEHEFFMGCLQQGTLQHFATFLIALALPLPVMRAGVPRILHGLYKLFQQPFTIWLINFITQPVFVVLLFMGLITFWLIPPIHFIAMLDCRLYRVMQWSMIASGLLFWGIILDPQSRYRVTTRIVMLLAVIPIQIAIGALLVFANQDFYPIYRICGRALAGLTPLQDQQIGGLIIWLHGAMMSIIGVAIIAVRDFIKR